MSLVCPADYHPPMRTILEIEGMSCVHCVRAVVTGLGGVPGITGADVSIGRAVVDHGPSVTLARLREAIEVAGYTVKQSVEERRRLPIL
jgi:copper chaperone